MSVICCQTVDWHPVGILIIMVYWNKYFFLLKNSFDPNQVTSTVGIKWNLMVKKGVVKGIQRTNLSYGQQAPVNFLQLLLLWDWTSLLLSKKSKK